MDTPTNLIVVTQSFPFPPDRGGKADVWRRICAFKQLGVNVFLVCWAEVEPSAAVLDAVRAKVSQLHYYDIDRGLFPALRRLVYLPVYPSHASSRLLGRRALMDLLAEVRAFCADAIWLDGPYGGAVGECLALELKIPLFYRSNNIEHEYMVRQARAARSLKNSAAWHFAAIGLERFQRRLMLRARTVFDCSMDDMAYWKALGITHIRWLPPLPESALLDDSAPKKTLEKTFDVVFLGNLVAPNNVRGVEWLVREIVPAVLALRPQTSFLIAGSNPDEYLRQLIASQPVITLLANPEDALAIYRSARVLVNPVRTGSGIHVKALEMLMMDAPLVSSVQGAAGMPNEVREQMRISNDSIEFAEAVVDELENSSVDIQARARARRFFSVESVRDLCSTFQKAQAQ